MAKNKLFLKAGSTFFADPATVSKEVKKASYVEQIIVRFLNAVGVPIVLECCDPMTNVPVSWNTETDTLQAWINGAWVDVNNAASLSTTTTTIPPTTTTTIP